MVTVIEFCLQILCAKYLDICLLIIKHYCYLLQKQPFVCQQKLGWRFGVYLFVIIITTMIMFVINIIIIEYQSGCLFASKSSDIGCAMRLLSPQASCAAV